MHRIPMRGSFVQSLNLCILLSRSDKQHQTLKSVPFPSSKWPRIHRYKRGAQITREGDRTQNPNF